jgi:hypothetical protein
LQSLHLQWTLWWCLWPLQPQVGVYHMAWNEECAYGILARAKDFFSQCLLTVQNLQTTTINHSALQVQVQNQIPISIYAETFLLLSMKWICESLSYHNHLCMLSLQPGSTEWVIAKLSAGGGLLGTSPKE